MSGLRKAILYAGLVLSLGAFSAYVTYSMLGRGMTVKVPDLKGRSIGDAKASLGTIGLDLRVEAEVFDLATPRGAIIRQSLSPGTTLSGAHEIAVTVSRGPEMRRIPMVVGMQLGNAREAIVAQKLTFGKVILVHSDKIAQDIVIAQYPAPEQWTGEPITLIASLGSDDVSYYCPSFVGLDRKSAEEIAKELGVVLEITPNSLGDAITFQRPEAGAEIRIGETVTITLGGEHG